MSAQSLLKGYDGELPTLAFSVGGPGTAPNLAEVLAEGASANDLAINDLAALNGSTAGDLEVSSGAGHGLILSGAVGASLTATTGGCKVESTDGVLELNADGASGELNIVLPAGKRTAALGTNVATAVNNQLQIQIGGTNYWIPLASSAIPSS